MYMMYLNDNIWPIIKSEHIAVEVLRRERERRESWGRGG
jgi:hypothetical protein